MISSLSYLTATGLKSLNPRTLCGDSSSGSPQLASTAGKSFGVPNVHGRLVAVDLSPDNIDLEDHCPRRGADLG